MDRLPQTEISEDDAVTALSALAQPHRLAAFRLLVQAGDSGLAAGNIATQLDLRASSLSFHLAHLERSGLILKRRNGRSLIYRAHFQAMNDLVGYLTENCCSSNVCAPTEKERTTA